MARYYQTVDRKYLDDGIYMPPVELMSKVIAAKDAEIDDAIKNIDVVKGQALTNIKYWDKYDKPQAQAAMAYWNDKTNDITRQIIENPLSSNPQQLIRDAQMELASSIGQGGDIYNLIHNVESVNNMQEAFGKMKDQEAAGWYKRYNMDRYGDEDIRGDNPLVEENKFDWQNQEQGYIQPGEVANINDFLMDAASKIKSNTKDVPWISYTGQTAGLSGATKTTEVTEDMIKKVLNGDIKIENLPSAVLNTMINDDKLSKRYGSDYTKTNGRLWLEYDEDGNVVGINKGNDSMWKSQVDQAVDTFSFKNVDKSLNIWDEKMYKKALGIGDEEVLEDDNILGEDFVSNSELHQDKLADAIRKTLFDRNSKSVVIGRTTDKNGKIINPGMKFSLLNNGYLGIEKGGTVVTASGEDMAKLEKFMNQRRNNNEQNDFEKSLFKNWTNSINNVKIPKKDTDKIKKLKYQIQHTDSNNKIHTGGSGTSAYQLGDGFTWNDLNSGTMELEDLIKNGYLASKGLKDLIEEGDWYIKSADVTDDFYNLETDGTGTEHYQTNLKLTIEDQMIQDGSGNDDKKYPTKTIVIPVRFSVLSNEGGDFNSKR